MTGLTINAPVRVDLAGGTLDIWPLSVMVPGAATVNCTLSSGITLKATPRSGTTRLVNRNTATESKWPSREPDLHYLSAVVDLFAETLSTGWTFSVHSDVPRGSGLGTSSVILSAMLTACSRLTGRSMTNPEIVRTAMDLEAGLIRYPTGIQDYIAPLYGGISHITFPPGGFQVDSLPFPPDLSTHGLLIFTGIQHFSGVPNWEVFKLMLDDSRHREMLAALADISHDTTAALRDSDMTQLGKTLRADYDVRKQLDAPLVPDCPDLFRMLESDADVMGFRMCGAAGGGCVFALVEPGAKAPLMGRLDRISYRTLNLVPQDRRMTIADA